MELKGFIGPSYESQAVTADVEDCINWYLEILDSQGATAQATLYPTPGVTQLSSVATGPGRAHGFFKDREFAVIGTTFYEISMAGALTSRGTVALGANPATISSNGDGGGQIFITSGGNGYIFTLATNVLAQVAALNGKATMGGHLDGYFLALDSSTSTLYVSNLLDGSVWQTGVQFAQRSIASDPWVSMIVSGRYIWLLGQRTSEAWYDTGASFPFAPHPSGLVQKGCAAPFSAVVSGLDLRWLSTTADGGYEVVTASGFTPERISKAPIETAIGGYAVVSDAIADSYNERGHTFYLLTFPAQDITWCWDATTRLWHKRGTWSVTNNRYTALRARWHVSAWGQHRMLDSQTGAVYSMSSAVATDVDGLGIRRLRRAPALEKENLRIQYPGFEVGLERGEGLATGQGSDPQVMMRFSDDSGKTWSAERWRSAGPIGKYGTRVRWNRLGTGRRRSYEVVTSDPIPYKLTGAFLTPDPVVLDGKAA